MRKGHIKIPVCFVGVCHSNLVFVEERPDLHTPLQQTNEQTHNFKITKIEFTRIYFPRRLLNEQR